MRFAERHRKSRAAAGSCERRGPGGGAFFRNPMPDVSFDCVSCGACCFSRNPRYLELLPWDAARSLPETSLFTEEGRTFLRFDCGHCIHLDLSNGKAACGVYEDRPEACRAFRAGSFECVKARRANGVMGALAREAS